MFWEILCQRLLTFLALSVPCQTRSHTPWRPKSSQDEPKMESRCPSWLNFSIFVPTSCQKGPNLKPTWPKIVQLVAKIFQNRSPSSSRPPPNLQKSSKIDGGSFVFTLSPILETSRLRCPKCSKMLPKMVPS